MFLNANEEKDLEFTPSGIRYRAPMEHTWHCGLCGGKLTNINGGYICKNCNLKYRKEDLA